MSKTYVGDTPDIILDVGQDISDASVSIAVLMPGGTNETEWDATVYTENDETKYVHRKALKTDFSVPGKYKIQPIVSFNGGDEQFRGETAQLKVYDTMK